MEIFGRLCPVGTTGRGAPCFMRELPGFGKRNGSRMRVLKWDDLAPIVVGVIWRGRLPALADELAGEFRNRARQLLT